MKQFIFHITFATFLWFAQTPRVLAQDNSHKLSTIEQKIQNKDLLFVANWVNPMTGTGRQLTDYYTLSIHKDSIIADLPYFGRSYTAPIDPTNIGVSLTDTGFSYSFIKKKKGRWDISIKPKNQSSIQSFLLTVYDDGTAYLDVTCTNRNPISYRGTIEDKHK